MGSFFLVCAIVGGGALLLQLVLGAFGLDGGHDVGHIGLGDAGSGHALVHPGDPDAAHGSGASAGLDLFSVRALTAGLAFFGLAGLALLYAGWPAVLALLGAAVPGLLAMVAVAYVMRWFLRLQSDGSLRAVNAIGCGATVYIPIPGADAGPGKVMLTLQDRTVEYDAVTRGERLPTGTAVTVVDVRDGDVLEVVPTPDPLSEIR